MSTDLPPVNRTSYFSKKSINPENDGQVNSQDAVFAQLRVWRDVNQDGVSQATELQTLAQAGIASIGVVGTVTNNNSRMCKRCARARIRPKSVTNPRIGCVDSYDFSSSTKLSMHIPRWHSVPWHGTHLKPSIFAEETQPEVTQR
jgi:hypothetical protein